MEAILILFSGLVELLAGLIPAVVGVVVGLASLLVDLVALAIPWRPGGGVQSLDPETVPESPSPPSSSPNKRKRPAKWRWIRWILGGFGVLGILLAVLLVLVETVWFEQTLRWIAIRQGDRTGIRISFEEVEGSFLSREFRFDGLTAEREASNDAAAFDLRIERVSGTFDGPPWTVPDRMPFLEVRGLTGDVHLPAPEPEKRKQGHMLAISMDRGLTIARLMVEGCEVDLHLPGREAAVPVRVTEWVSAPMGSRTHVFDLLFRSNLSATVGDAEVGIRSEDVGKGRRTLWRAENLTVDLLSDLFGAPWDLFTSGRVDLRVEDEWELEETVISEVEKEDVYIHTDWLVTVSDAELREPSLWPGAGLSRRAVVNRAFAEFANRKLEDRSLELGFHFTFDRGLIDASLSDSLNRIWQAAFNAWLATRTNLEPEKVETLKEGALKTGDWLRRRWEERRVEREGE